MNNNDSLFAVDCPFSTVLPLIDTHTHFDAPVFESDRGAQASAAHAHGVQHLVLVGYLYRYFERLFKTQHDLRQVASLPTERPATTLPLAHIALGLHPFYIDQHTDAHLSDMADLLHNHRPLAIGEIGLDTYTDAMKQPDSMAKQRRFFNAQLDMAVTHQLPVMLHIRKAHAEALAILKAHQYDAHQLGGIAHSFSGGEQEAKAFVKLGFKLGVTGQVTNPNAKKLHRAIKTAVGEYGIGCLVIETDCPDMTPVMCQTTNQNMPMSHVGQNPGDLTTPYDKNVPANLPWVLSGLSKLLAIPEHVLAPQLWQSSCEALQTSWPYPIR